MTSQRVSSHPLRRHHLQPRLARQRSSTTKSKTITHIYTYMGRTGRWGCTAWKRIDASKKKKVINQRAVNVLEIKWEAYVIVQGAWGWMRRRRDIRREMVHCRKVLSLRIIHSEPMDGWNGTMMLLREICWVLLGFGMCKYDMAAKKKLCRGVVCLFARGRGGAEYEQDQIWIMLFDAT